MKPQTLSDFPVKFDSQIEEKECFLENDDDFYKKDIPDFGYAPTAVTVGDYAAAFAEGCAHGGLSQW